ncbi:MAG: carbohydrate porin [Planctomycetes bacterium]|nr:carbohydrate porin [Planctomycetota bacterium]
MSRRHAAAALAATFTIAPDAAAQEAGEREWIGGRPFSEWRRVAGDLGGLRTALEDVGIEVAGTYVADFAAPWSGSGRRRSALPSLLDVNVAFDLEYLLGLPRTTAYIDAYDLLGRDISRDIGDFQGVSNIQGQNGAQIAEVWCETWLFDSFRVKAGKIDFNSEFAVAELSGDFVNSTAALPSTIVAYPTFPNPATAVNLFYAPDEYFYVGVGLFDGANAEGVNTGRLGPAGFFGGDDSDAWFVCEEVGVAWQGGGTWGSGRLAVGAFQHTAKFTRFSDGGTTSGTAGGWATFEQTFWRENPAEPDDQGIGAFATIGFADDDVSAVGNSVALGVNWVGAFPGRDFDAIGLGVFRVDLSDEPAAGTPEDETAFELFYKLQLTPAITVKPELQYVLNPGGATGVDDVLIGLLRVEILF